MPVRAIGCREFVNLVGAFHDKDLSAAQLSAFEAHPGRGEKCREYLNSYEATIRLAKSAMQAPERAVPDTIPEDLVEEILAALLRQK